MVTVGGGEEGSIGEGEAMAGGEGRGEGEDGGMDGVRRIEQPTGGRGALVFFFSSLGDG